jgi:8-oxo-dGTP diphosphatase
MKAGLLLGIVGTCPQLRNACVKDGTVSRIRDGSRALGLLGSIRGGLRRLLRMSLLLAIRITPLPWNVKWWLIWLGGPKVLFAACALIRDSVGRVLVLRSRYSGDWQLPGGCAKRGESALHALERECSEELGLGVRAPQLLGVYVGMHGLTQCALFACELSSGTIRLSEEHSAYRYSTYRELPQQLSRMVSDASRLRS